MAGERPQTATRLFRTQHRTGESRPDTLLLAVDSGRTPHRRPRIYLLENRKQTKSEKVKVQFLRTKDDLGALTNEKAVATRTEFYGYAIRRRTYHFI